MSVNRFKPHIYVLPEDKADAELAQGFLLSPTVLNERSIRVLNPAGGWEYVVAEFKRTHIKAMGQNPARHLVMLLDFDNNDSRYESVLKEIPDDLIDRVFVIGVFSNPEKLRSDIKKSFENIGITLAKECASGEVNLWSHALLRHNAMELNRMTEKLKPILFQKDEPV